MGHTRGMARRWFKTPNSISIALPRSRKLVVVVTGGGDRAYIITGHIGKRPRCGQGDSECPQNICTNLSLPRESCTCFSSLEETPRPPPGPESMASSRKHSLSPPLGSDLVLTFLLFLQCSLFLSVTYVLP